MNGGDRNLIIPTIDASDLREISDDMWSIYAEFSHSDGQDKDKKSIPFSPLNVTPSASDVDYLLSDALVLGRNIILRSISSDAIQSHRYHESSYSYDSEIPEFVRKDANQAIARSAINYSDIKYLLYLDSVFRTGSLSKSIPYFDNLAGKMQAMPVSVERARQIDAFERLADKFNTLPGVQNLLRYARKREEAVVGAARANLENKRDRSESINSEGRVSESAKSR